MFGAVVMVLHTMKGQSTVASHFLQACRKLLLTLLLLLLLMSPAGPSTPSTNAAVRLGGQEGAPAAPPLLPGCAKRAITPLEGLP
jgi:hypothetical protein